MRHKAIFKWSLTGLNSIVSLSLVSYDTKIKETSLPYYLHIARGRIVEYIPFPMILKCEMQTAPSSF